jgi:pimeloyl-ACP methyl ester carboxylesterase
MQLQADVQGLGPPVMLVGASLTGSLTWVLHQDRLVTTRRVARVQPLQVQYGLEQRRLPDGYSLKTESRALARTADALSPGEPVDVVGWSLGGTIALDFALDHPDRIRTLTLIEPGAIWLLPPADQLDETSRRELDELRAITYQMLDDVTEAQLAAFIRMVGVVPPDMQPQQHPRWPIWVQHRLAMRGGAVEFEHRDDVARLRAFDRPVLLIKGEGSARWLHAIVDILAAALPRAELAELPGGHAAHLVAPDQFLARLATFQAR